ncbi:MAG TPA: DUF378 domain-containing protein [Candidatus Paceibacterota bacterium]|nr:DUF378 domain-containing protein [Candidatus Paceibacterota bacterium]HPT17937.1 DUF378 domain-containing protein [Candidatus Paceibacterota bacterium]
MSIIAKILVIIGGLNWGIIGVGMIVGKMNSWNVVHLLLGSAPSLELIIYLLVGIGAVIMLFNCSCNKCRETCRIEEKKEETQMQ